MAENRKTDNTTQESPVGNRWVGRNGIIILGVYLVILSVVLVLGIIQLWPPPPEASDTSQADAGAAFIFWTLSISAEAHMILLVTLASALGTQAHAIRSLYWYVGNRRLIFSWIMKYILMPFGGIALGLAFYFVIRGGFFAAGTDVLDLSPYGFMAMAFLVGMFSEQAVARLKRVAEAFFARAEVGRDSSPPAQTNSSNNG
ncbi:MAG TPA: hypothetical protein G4O18_06060 [Dehalococcoidia bacterium]|nr:hypothetical protein [Dehalococcoidia bacterium]